MTRIPAILLLLAACSETAHVSPAQYVPAKSPQRIVLVDKTGRYYVLEQPTIADERIRGVEVGTTDTVALPLSRVQEATVTRKSPVRTAILAGVLTGGAVAIILSAHNRSGEPCKLIEDPDDVVGRFTQCDPNYLDGNSR